MKSLKVLVRVQGIVEFFLFLNIVTAHDIINWRNSFCWSSAYLHQFFVLVHFILCIYLFWFVEFRSSSSYLWWATFCLLFVIINCHQSVLIIEALLPVFYRPISLASAVCGADGNLLWTSSGDDYHQQQQTNADQSNQTLTCRRCVSCLRTPI